MGSGGVGIDLGQQIGAPDLIQGLESLDVEGRNFKVAVVVPCQSDKFLQFVVAVKLLPLDIGHRFLFRIGRARRRGVSAGPDCRNRRGRLFIFRCHGSARGHGEYRTQKQTEGHRMLQCMFHVSGPPQQSVLQVLRCEVCIFSGQRAAIPAQRKME